MDKNSKTLLLIIGSVITFLCLCSVLVVAVIIFARSRGDNSISYTYGNSIVYRFQDSSVPPQYHRSYTITLTQDEASIVVDSYGDLIFEDTYSLEPGQYDAIIQIINEANLEKVAVSDSDGCTGGTSKQLEIFRDGELVFSGEQYRCGGDMFGNIDGDLEPIAEAILLLIPITPSET